MRLRAVQSCVCTVAFSGLLWSDRRAVWLVEVARTLYPGTTLLKPGQSVVHIHTCPCHQSLLRLAISHFPSNKIGVSIIVQGPSSVDAFSKDAVNRDSQYKVPPLDSRGRCDTAASLCSGLGAGLVPRRSTTSGPRDLCFHAQVEPESSSTPVSASLGQSDEAGSGACSEVIPSTPQSPLGGVSQPGLSLLMVQFLGVHSSNNLSLSS